MPSSHLGWQPSRFLTDRGEAQRAYVLAEQLGSINAAASQLGTTWAVAAQRLRSPRPGHAHPNPEADDRPLTEASAK